MFQLATFKSAINKDKRANVQKGISLFINIKVLIQPINDMFFFSL